MSDWLERIVSNHFSSSVEQESLLARAEKAEAAIKRVREIQQRYVSVSRDEMSQTDALGAIGRALDGERDE